MDVAWIAVESTVENRIFHSPSLESEPRAVDPQGLHGVDSYSGDLVSSGLLVNFGCGNRCGMCMDRYGFIVDEGVEPQIFHAV